MSDNVHQLFAGAIESFAPRPQRSGISDEQYDREVDAARRLKAAIDGMDLAIDNLNTVSGLRTVKEKRWDDFKHDELPNLKAWQERLEELRRGYL